MCPLFGRMVMFFFGRPVFFRPSGFLFIRLSGFGCMQKSVLNHSDTRLTHNLGPQYKVICKIERAGIFLFRLFIRFQENRN